ncbi:5726_t:CDS:2 [Acaulospora morrowiae]|uniref:5726_t:CDS:1 n=1 Tax=Acaulospora morrowiae TaxID=94023 RepID=A0A9N9G582_9GLOM|nr:5726_t:CDS:2 [Acaulospora morrowiae]
MRMFANPAFPWLVIPLEVSSLWCCWRNVVLAFKRYVKVLAFPASISLACNSTGGLLALMMADHVDVLKEVISLGFTASKFFKKIGYQFSQKDTAEGDLREAFKKLASMKDEHSRKAESFLNTIDEHMSSSSVVQYWNSVQIQNERDKTYTSQLVLEEQKKQHIVLIDSNVITEHNNSSNKLTLESSELSKLKDESVVVSESIQSSYDFRKRPNIDYNEERMLKRINNQDGHTTPSPRSPKLGNLPKESLIDNPFLEEEDDIIAINDVPDELYFVDGNLADDFKIGEDNVSQLFRQYQNESIRIAKTECLLVESNVHEILSLSSIFLLTPNSHSKIMINIFGSPLLDEIHQQFIPTQQTELDSGCESKFREAIKRATKESCGSATKWLLTELANNQTLDENLGFVNVPYHEMIRTSILLNGPTRVLTKAKQGNGKEEANNRTLQYLLSISYRQVASYSWDCLDSAIDKGADLKLLGFHCITKSTSI